jgi:hypothetical protein
MGGSNVSMGRALRVSSQEITEFEFHMPPTAVWSRPQLRDGMVLTRPSREFFHDSAGRTRTPT